MAEKGREKAENVMEGARETVQGAQVRAGEMYEHARRSGEQVRFVPTQSPFDCLLFL